MILKATKLFNENIYICLGEYSLNSQNQQQGEAQNQQQSPPNGQKSPKLESKKSICVEKELKEYKLIIQEIKSGKKPEKFDKDIAEKKKIKLLEESKQATGAMKDRADKKLTDEKKLKDTVDEMIDTELKTYAERTKTEKTAKTIKDNIMHIQT